MAKTEILRHRNTIQCIVLNCIALHCNTLYYMNCHSLCDPVVSWKFIDMTFNNSIIIHVSILSLHCIALHCIAGVSARYTGVVAGITAACLLVLLLCGVLVYRTVPLCKKARSGPLSESQDTSLPVTGTAVPSPLLGLHGQI